MMIKSEIQVKYLAQHDALGSRKDAIDKELFDQQHAQVWADCNAELKARKDALKAKASLSSKEKAELSELTMMFPEPTPPVRDLAKEIDELTEKVKKLVKK